MTKSYQGFEGDLELANSARSGLATLRARDSAGAEHTLSLDPDTAILSIDGSPISYVVESGSNANGFYRKHSDGYIEQWGSTTVNANSSKVQTLPVPFTSAPTGRNATGTNADGGSEATNVSAATTTTITLFTAYNASQTVYWSAQGY